MGTRCGTNNELTTKHAPTMYVNRKRGAPLYMEAALVAANMLFASPVVQKVMESAATDWMESTRAWSAEDPMAWSAAGSFHMQGNEQGL